MGGELGGFIILPELGFVMCLVGESGGLFLGGCTCSTPACVPLSPQAVAREKRGLTPDSPNSEDDSKNTCLHSDSQSTGAMVLPYCGLTRALPSSVATISGPHSLRGMEMDWDSFRGE